MPRVTIDEVGRLALPPSTTQAFGGRLPAEYWLEQREGSLILHPRVPDVRRLYLEPTTGCNLSCRTCIRNVWEDPVAQMDEATFAAVMASISALPELKRVVFTGFGEPLAHPRILDMIKAVRDRGLAVTLGSNGLLLDRRMARELIMLGVDRLVVSLDGVQSDTYADIRGVPVSPVVENIRALTALKSELGTPMPILGVEFVAMRRNVEELPALTQLAAQLGATRVLVSNVLAYSRDMYDEILYGYEPRTPLSPRSWPVRIDAFVMWGNLDLPRMHWAANRRCRFVADKAAVVGWDGGVAPCYALSHNYSYFAVDGRQKQVSRYALGNAREQSLAEVWMSEDYVRFRAEVQAFHFPSCPDCDLRDTCDMRGHNEGCWGWNPSCADCLWAQDIVRCP
jgi:tungsten cofactor oxidoreducase radical SAM maturase